VPIGKGLVADLPRSKRVLRWLTKGGRKPTGKVPTAPVQERLPDRADMRLPAGVLQFLLKSRAELMPLLPPARKDTKYTTVPGKVTIRTAKSFEPVAEMDVLRDNPRSSIAVRPDKISTEIDPKTNTSQADRLENHLIQWMRGGKDQTPRRVEREAAVEKFLRKRSEWKAKKTGAAKPGTQTNQLAYDRTEEVEPAQPLNPHDTVVEADAFAKETQDRNNKPIEMGFNDLQKSNSGKRVSRPISAAEQRTLEEAGFFGPNLEEQVAPLQEEGEHQMSKVAGNYQALSGWGAMENANAVKFIRYADRVHARANAAGPPAQIRSLETWARAGDMPEAVAAEVPVIQRKMHFREPLTPRETEIVAMARRAGEKWGRTQGYRKKGGKAKPPDAERTRLVAAHSLMDYFRAGGPVENIELSLPNQPPDSPGLMQDLLGLKHFELPPKHTPADLVERARHRMEYNRRKNSIVPAIQEIAKVEDRKLRYLYLTRLLQAPLGSGPIENPWATRPKKKG
jgi:hypothetical protein